MDREKVQRLARVAVEVDCGEGEPYRVGVEVEVDHKVNGIAALQAIQRSGIPMAAANQVSMEDFVILMTEDMGETMDKLKERFGRGGGSS